MTSAISSRRASMPDAIVRSARLRSKAGSRRMASKPRSAASMASSTCSALAR